MKRFISASEPHATPHTEFKNGSLGSNDRKTHIRQDMGTGLSHPRDILAMFQAGLRAREKTIAFP